MKKVAIVGCGMITNSAHIPAYRHLPDNFEIVSVCDIDEKKAKETAERHGIGAYFTSFEAMLEKMKPELVSVCVPNMLHGQYVKAALESGADVLCEKPLSMSYKEAKELYSLAKRKGRLLCACQSMRFTDDRLKAKELITKGELGEIYYGEISRIRTRGIPMWGAFHIEKLSGGGAFIDIGVHMLDALMWLMDNPKVISVSGTKSAYLAHGGYRSAGDKASGALSGNTFSEKIYSEEEFDVEDFASGSILLEGGKRINFKTAWALNLPDETSITLVGDKSSVKLPELMIFDGANTEKRDADRYKNPYPNESFFGHFRLFDRLADYYMGKGDIPIKPEETLGVTAIIDLFYRSAKESREVKMEELEESL